MNRHAPPPHPLRTAAAILAVGLVGLMVLLPLYFGKPALEVELPGPGDTVGLEGLEVLVTFDPPDRVEASTLRVLLNGAEVTDRLDVAGNGAHGRLHGLLDGANELRVEIFRAGPGPWLRWVEEAHVREVRFRRPIAIDQG